MKTPTPPPAPAAPTVADLIASVRRYNRWRRGSEDEADYMHPKDIGIALEGVCSAAETLQKQLDEARHELLAIFAREHLTCGWCGEMMPAPPNFTPPMTTEFLKQTVRLHILDCPKHPIRENELEVCELRAAIHQTIMENLHLADGDDCTLKILKDVIGFELPPEEES